MLKYQFQTNAEIKFGLKLDFWTRFKTQF